MPQNSKLQLKITSPKVIYPHPIIFPYYRFTFKALPVQFTHFDSERIMQHIYQNKIGKEVLQARGDQVKHSIRVKIVQYPENICAVWVMVAVRFRSMH